MIRSMTSPETNENISINWRHFFKRKRIIWISNVRELEVIYEWGLIELILKTCQTRFYYCFNYCNMTIWLWHPPPCSPPGCHPMVTFKIKLINHLFIWIINRFICFHLRRLQLVSSFFHAIKLKFSTKYVQSALNLLLSGPLKADQWVATVTLAEVLLSGPRPYGAIWG